MKPLPPIRTPFLQRWLEFRIEYLPKVAFVCAVALAVVAWQRWVWPVEVSTPDSLPRTGHDVTNSVAEFDRGGDGVLSPNNPAATPND